MAACCRTSLTRLREASQHDARSQWLRALPPVERDLSAVWMRCAMNEPFAIFARPGDTTTTGALTDCAFALAAVPTAS
eukprot:6189257-Pleurochrysis_carterae.AAC.3